MPLYSQWNTNNVGCNVKTQGNTVKKKMTIHIKLPYTVVHVIKKNPFLIQRSVHYAY